ncbi:forespore capture DNA-binding protein RefZ [Bacillus manliponensis]|uniref:forespore capture DNA-binding protein RefZ n=1 Tax=Bacillus manliponensis TaxID=574376 RepID=UPI0035114A90
MKQTREKIIEAAISLFYTKGYDGTSVRDIAKKANVNVANISYYFDGKQGLLEQLVTSFLEGYIKVIEDKFQKYEFLSAKDVLFEMVSGLLQYQFQHRQLTRFFYRELSLDSTLIREVMTIYFSKEKYYVEQVLKRGEQTGEFNKVSFTMFMTKLKGMMSMPFLYPQYISEVLHAFPSEEFFMKMYIKDVEEWLQYTLCGMNMNSTLPRAIYV